MAVAAVLAGVAVLAASLAPMSGPARIYSSRRALPLIVFEWTHWPGEGIEVSLHTRAGLEPYFAFDDKVSAARAINPNAYNVISGEPVRFVYDPFERSSRPYQSPSEFGVHALRTELRAELGRRMFCNEGPYILLALPNWLIRSIAALLVLVGLRSLFRKRDCAGTGFDVAPRPPPLAPLPSPP